MSDFKKEPAASDNIDSTKVVLDLKGAEQHHPLKNNPGENRDQSHADTSEAASGVMKETILETSDEAKADTAIGAELKKTVD